MKRKILSVVLVLAMALSLLPTAVFAADYSDTRGHWAESAISRWSGYGVVGGHEGQFRPDATMTRAEAASVFANLFALTDASAKKSYPDLNNGAWYDEAMNKCINAGIMNGMDGLANPDGTMTREMFFVMFARGLGLKEQSTTKGLPADGASWSAGYINALTDKGYVAGMENAQGVRVVNATGLINRASVMTLLDQTVTAYANANGATVNGTGKGVVLVVADDVTVSGNVDTLVVAGAKASSVTRVDENGAVIGSALYAAPGNRSVKLLNAVVQLLNIVAGNTNLSIGGGSSVGSVAVTENAPSTAVEVAADAKVETIETAAPATELDVSGTVGSVAVAETAAGTAVEVAAGATVASIETAAASTSIDNSGVITSVAVAETATGAAVTAAAGSYTGAVITEAASTSVSGSGAVANVVASGDAAASGSAATVSTSGTSVSKVDSTGKTETSTNSGSVPAANSSNASAASSASTAATAAAAEAVKEAESAAGNTSGSTTPATTPTTTGGGGGSYDYTPPAPTSADVTTTYGVTTANLDDRAVDGDEEDSDLAGTYTATATKWSNHDYVDVTVSAGALKAHLNGDDPADYGYWIGVAFNAPAGATEYKAAVRLNQSSVDSAFSGVSSATVGGVFTQYIDAGVANQRDFWVKLEWLNDSSETIQGPTTFHVVINATLDTSTLGTVGTANLDDRAHEGDEDDSALATNYNAAATFAPGTNFLTANVAVTADTLKYHQSGDAPAALGDWIGFKVDGPIGATHYKYKASLSEITTGFSSEAAVESTTFVQYTDYLAENQRAYYVLLQWFSDSGSTAVTCPVLYHVTVSVTTPETGAQAMALRPNAEESVTGDDSFAYNTEYGNAGISLTDHGDGTADLAINGTTLTGYVSADENTAKVAALSHNIGGTDYMFAGIQFTKPSDDAVKVKVSTDDGATWGDAIQLQGELSNGETGVYDEELVLYFGVAKKNGSALLAISNELTEWTRYFQWLDGSDNVVGYTKAVITRTVDPDLPVESEP